MAIFDAKKNDTILQIDYCLPHDAQPHGLTGSMSIGLTRLQSTGLISFQSMGSITLMSLGLMGRTSTGASQEQHVVIFGAFGKDIFDKNKVLNFGQNHLVALSWSDHRSGEWSRINHGSDRRRRRARIEDTNGFPAVSGHDNCWLEERVWRSNDLSKHSATAVATKCE